MARQIATNRTVEREELRDFVRPRHQMILLTQRADGSPQASPVTGGVDDSGRIVIATYPDRAKTRNVRARPTASVLVLSPEWNDAWVQVDGDAEVLIWERQWERHKDTKVLEYDLLQAPHHCSWHTLSHESWSETKGKAKVSADARSALSVTRKGAMIVASCAPIKDDYNDPPCFGAKREYEAIAKCAGGSFTCVGEQPTESNPEPLELTVSAEGLSLPAKQETGRKSAAIITSASTPMPHGSR